MTLNRIHFFVLLSLIGLIALSGCLNGDSGFDDIPTDYEETRSINLGNDISVTQYVIETNASSQVLNDLRKMAENDGWEVIADWKGTFVGYEVGLALEKEDKVMVINTAVSNGATTATIISGPKEAADLVDMNNDSPSHTVDEEEYITGVPPTKDVDGQDIADVPRYPKSVRIEYLSLTVDSDHEKEQVEYLTADNSEDVKIFYENELEAQGWENIISQALTQRDDVGLLMEANKDSRTVQLATQSSSDYEDMNKIIIYVERRMN